jgi:choline-sulfatase
LFLYFPRYPQFAGNHVSASLSAIARIGEGYSTVSRKFESGSFPLDCGGCDAALAGRGAEGQGKPSTAKAPPLAARSIADRPSSPMRSLPLLLLLLSVVPLASGCQPPHPVDPLLRIPRGAAAGYNLLIITLDTTRADRLGCYGYAKAQTPVLDGIAARGFRFTDAITTAPVTLPSHATIFTGLYPPNHGARSNSEYQLPPAPVTLAERLHDAGYDTAAFVSAFVLDARFGLNQGFARYDDAVATATGPAFPSHTLERSAQAVTDAARAWFQQRTANTPFFAWVHYFDAHAPYAPPAPFATQFAGHLYDGELAAIDAQVGRLLQTVAEHGQRDRTIVLVVGDHGESLGEHDETTHSVFLYDAVMRVPLLLAAPGIIAEPAVIADRVVSTADMLPTLLDLLGLDDPHVRDGVSLLRHAPTPSRAVYMESIFPYLEYGWAPLFGLRRLHDKYLLAPRPEYYDLRADPDETTNAFPTATGTTHHARDELATALTAHLQQWPSLDTLATATTTPSPETIERLRSLGYISEAGPTATGERADPKDMVTIVTMLQQANALLASGQAAPALALVRQAEQRSPRDRAVLHLLAKIHLRMGNLVEAETALRAFTAIKPKADVSLLLAQIIMLDGRHGEAERLLAEALQLDPHHGGVLIARGDLRARQGRPAEAKADYERARALDPYRTTTVARNRLAQLERTRTTPYP